MLRMPDAFEALRSGLEIDPTNAGLKQAFERCHNIADDDAAAAATVDDTLHQLCRSGETENVKSMLDSVDVNQQDGQKSTPLHHAATEGKIDIARLLTDAGANVNLTNTVQQTPLHLAAWNGR